MESHPKAIEYELLECIDDVDYQRFEEIIEKNEIDLNQRLIDGRLLLNIAVADGLVRIVEFLLKSGASAIAMDRDGNIALHYAIKKDREEIGKLLLQQDVDAQLHIKNHKGESVNEWITKHQSKKHWIDLISQQKTANAVPDSNEKRRAMKRNKGTNAKNREREKGEAASPQHVEDVCAAGSSVEVSPISQEDNNAIKHETLVRANDYNVILKELLELICNDINNNNKFEEIIENSQIDLDQMTSDGKLLLHEAVLHDRIKFVEILLKYGASALTTDRNGKLALGLAIEYDRREIGKLLLQRNVNEQLHTSRNPQGEPLSEWITKDATKRHWLDLVPQKECRPGFIGNLYQLNILALLSLRSYKNERFMKFKLAMEVAEFGKFDDIVFECQGLKLIMQIKHKSRKENSEIDKDEILPGKNKKSAFSLRMYYESFRELLIKGQRDIEELIILTNATLSRNCERYFEEDALAEDHILSVDQSSVIKRYKIKGNEIKKHNSMRGIDEGTFALFCQKFHLILNFPDEEATQKLIKTQIGELFKLSNSEVADFSFMQKIQNWFKEQVSRPITTSMISDLYEVIDDNIDIMHAIGFNKINCDNLPKITFASHNDEVESFIQNRDEKVKVLIIHTSCVQLTSKRIVDHFYSIFKNDDDFLFILHSNLLPKHHQQSQVIMKAIKSRNSFKALLVACSNGLDEIFSEFHEELNSSNKKIIFVRTNDTVPRNDSDIFESYFRNSRATQDNPAFIHFSDKSQQQFMEKEIKFEGRTVRISDIISKQLVDEVFEPQALYESITSQSKIKIQSPYSFESSPEYIPRRLAEIGGRLVFQEKTFYTPRFNQNIIICGDPGAGKSSLLTSIQQNMNKIDGGVWSIKLNLNDFAHDASKENHFSRIDFTEHETEKSIEFLCKMLTPSTRELSLSQKLTRKLLAFCLKHELRANEVLPKIVLLFDGFDEVAPKYTEQVLRLFRTLNDTNIKLMCISTRNHEVETLTKIFKRIKYEATINLFPEQTSEMSEIVTKQKPFKIIFRERDPNSDPNAINAFNASKVPKNLLSNVPIIQSILEKIILHHSHENSDLSVYGQTNIFTSSIDLVPFQRNRYNIKNSERFFKLLHDILATDSDLTFEQIDSSSSCTDKESPFNVLEVKYNNIYLHFSVDLYEESDIKIIVSVENYEVFNLLNPNKREKCGFLLKYYESHQDEIIEEMREVKMTNIFTLCKIIDENYGKSPPVNDKAECEHEETLTNPLEIAKRTCSVNILPQHIARSLKSFLATPIHLQMLAELSVKGQLEFSAEVRLHKIYQDLITLKENIYLDEKQRQGSNADESRRASVEKARFFHKMMARAFLLSEETAEFEKSLLQDQQTLHKCGLTSYRSGQLEFVHRSYAEWFLAMDIWENISKEDTQRLLFERILVDRSFVLTRQFLDSILREQSTYEGLRISVPYIPFYQNDTWNVNFSLLRVSSEGHFHVLRLLLKTLENCYQLFIGAQYEFLNQSEIYKIFSDKSNFNRETFNFTLEILEDKWKNLQFETRKGFMENIPKTHIDWRTFLLGKDLRDNSILYNSHYGEEEIEYILTKFKTELDSETFRNFVLNTSFTGETFLFRRWNCEDYSPVYNILEILPQDILKPLIETCDFKGQTIFYHFREKQMHRELFGILCNLMEFSEDFLIITIFGDFFSKEQSLNAVLQEFEDIFINCNQSQQLEEQRHIIREMVRRNKSAFELSLVKLNEALRRQSLDEIDLVLSDSKEYIRELVLACKYKCKFVLQNTNIILKIAEHLAPHRVIYQHWILRLPFTLIEKNFEATFERIFPRVSEILITMEFSSFCCLFISYISKAFDCDRWRILKVLLNFIDTFEKSTKEDLLLYRDLRILIFIPLGSQHSKKIPSNFRPLKWLVDDINNFEDETVIKVLMFCADHYFTIPFDESICRVKVFRWLNARNSVTRKQMNKIFFGLLFCNFQTTSQELVNWIENKGTELPFRLIDVVHFDILQTAYHGDYLDKIFDCFEALNLKSEFLQFSRVKDRCNDTFLHRLPDFDSVAKFIPIVVKEFGWDFVLFRNILHQSFLTHHNTKEYFTDILQLLKDLGMDRSALGNLTFTEIHWASKSQPNFTRTIDFCLENFRSIFEDWLSKDSNSILGSVASSTKSYEIFVHLDTQCGDKCKKSLFDYISQKLSARFKKKNLNSILKFVLRKYVEQNTQYAPLFKKFERISLELLCVAEETMPTDKWKNYFLFPPEANFSNVLSKFLARKPFSISNRKDKNLLHLAFARGIALKVLEIIPKRHLKRLLYEVDSYSRIPLCYLQREEDLRGLLEFISEKVKDAKMIRVLEKLNTNRNEDSAEQWSIELEKLIKSTLSEGGGEETKCKWQKRKLPRN